MRTTAAAMSENAVIYDLGNSDGNESLHFL